ncbi:MAG: peptidoglycan-binding domain-containing protein [Candidatus Thorarchaeota archaeon]|jgi:hypothetical protein
MAKDIYARYRDVEGKKQLQRDLNAMGYTDNRGRSLQVDGILGNLTGHAVRKMQRDAGISIDGIVGPQTIDKMERRGFIGTAPISAGVQDAPPSTQAPAAQGNKQLPVSKPGQQALGFTPTQNYAWDDSTSQQLDTIPSQQDSTFMQQDTMNNPLAPELDSMFMAQDTTNPLLQQDTTIVPSYQDSGIDDVVDIPSADELYNYAKDLNPAELRDLYGSIKSDYDSAKKYTASQDYIQSPTGNEEYHEGYNDNTWMDSAVNEMNLSESLAVIDNLLGAHIRNQAGEFNNKDLSEMWNFQKSDWVQRSSERENVLPAHGYVFGNIDGETQLKINKPLRGDPGMSQMFPSQIPGKGTVLRSNPKFPNFRDGGKAGNGMFMTHENSPTPYANGGVAGRPGNAVYNQTINSLSKAPTSQLYRMQKQISNKYNNPRMGRGERTKMANQMKAVEDMISSREQVSRGSNNAMHMQQSTMGNQHQMQMANFGAMAGNLMGMMGGGQKKQGGSIDDMAYNFMDTMLPSRYGNKVHSYANGGKADGTPKDTAYTKYTSGGDYEGDGMNPDEIWIEPQSKYNYKKVLANMSPMYGAYNFGKDVYNKYQDIGKDSFVDAYSSDDWIDQIMQEGLMNREEATKRYNEYVKQGDYPGATLFSDIYRPAVETTANYAKQARGWIKEKTGYRKGGKAGDRYGKRKGQTNYHGMDDLITPSYAGLSYQPEYEPQVYKNGGKVIGRDTLDAEQGSGAGFFGYPKAEPKYTRKDNAGNEKYPLGSSMFLNYIPATGEMGVGRNPISEDQYKQFMIEAERNIPIYPYQGAGMMTQRSGGKAGAKHPGTGWNDKVKKGKLVGNSLTPNQLGNNARFYYWSPSSANTAGYHNQTKGARARSRKPKKA